MPSRGRIAIGTQKLSGDPSPKVRFAPDSLLEGGVYCELVSEIGVSAAWAKKQAFPGGLWMITVGRNAILGSYSLEIVFLSLGAFARHFRRKLLKVLTVSGPGILPAGEFTVYKRAGPTTDALIQLKT